MARKMTVILLALVISIVISCVFPLAEKGKANAAEAEAAKIGNKPAAAGPAPEKAVDDYSTMFKLIPDDENFRRPTAEEIKKLGPLWPTVPPEKNAVYYFVKANRDLIARCEKSPEPPGSASQDEPYAGDAVGFTRYIKENVSVLATFKQGMDQRALQYPWLIFKGRDPCPALCYMADIRNLARFLSDTGFAAELEGQPDVAADLYLECMRMGYRLQENSMLIVQLVAMWILEVGSRNLDHLVANSSLNAATLKRIIALSREMETTPKTRLATMAREAEYVMVAMAMSPETADAFGKDYDAFNVLLLAMFSKPLPELLRSADAAIKEVKDKHPLQAETAGVWFEGLPHEWARDDLEMRVLQVRAAIALYQRQHGAPPELLDALVPEFLPEVPADPFDGKPLRYARTENGWKLWSVGYDLKDDGGEASIVDEEGTVGPDFVYTDKVRCNIERRSRGAIKSLPAPAEKPKEPAGAGR